MSLPTPENIAELLQLAEIERQQEDLRQRIAEGDFATPEIADAYTRGVEELGKKALSLAASPEVQVAYADFGREAQLGLQQLEPLKGILPETDLEALQSDLGARIMSAREFYDTYGARELAAQDFLDKLTPAELALATTAEITEVAAVEILPAENEPAKADEPVQPASPEAVTPKTDITITVGLNVARIGKEGVTVRYSTKKSEKFRDYTEPRRNALLAMTSLADGETIHARELFAAAFGRAQEFDGNLMLQIRSWFDRLTFRREKMFFCTARGMYYVNPKFRLASQLGAKLEAEIEQEPEAATAELEPVELPEVAEPKELDLPGAMWIMADKLRSLSFVLKEKGIDVITDDMVEAMAEHKPDMSFLRGDSEGIRDHRLNAMQMVMDLINDQEKFFEYCDSIDESSSEYRFVEFLGAIEEGERDLVQRLLTSRIVNTKNVRGQVVAVPTQVFGIDGVLIYPFPARPEPSRAASKAVEGSAGESDEELSEIEAAESEQAGDPASEVIDHLDRQEVDEAEELITEEPTATEEQRGRWNEREQAQFEALRLAATDYAIRFIARFDPAERQALPTLINVFPRFNSRNMANARDNGILARMKKSDSNKSYSVHETVMVLLYADTSFKNFLKTRKYKAEANRIINESVEQAIQAAKNQAAR